MVCCKNIVNITFFFYIYILDNQTQAHYKNYFSLGLGLGFLSSVQLCQVINSKSDIYGVNVGALGFTALDLTAFSKLKSLFFLNRKQNLLFIYFFLVRNTMAEVLMNTQWLKC